MAELALVLLQGLAYWRLSLSVISVGCIVAGLSFWWFGEVDTLLVTITVVFAFLISVFYFYWPEKSEINEFD